MSINKGKFDHAKLSNPRIVGPGGWKALHILALYDDMNGQNIYPGFVRFFCEKFKCGDCREHCGLHLSKNPPEKFKGQKWGMSEHSRQFHNSVNKGLGKPLMDWDTYEKIWIEDDKEGVCSKGCGDNKHSPEELSEVNFTRLKSLSLKDPSLVQVTKLDGSSYSVNSQNLTLVKRKR